MARVATSQRIFAAWCMWRTRRCANGAPWLKRARDHWSFLPARTGDEVMIRSNGL
jgi:hypothetical protein